MITRLLALLVLLVTTACGGGQSEQLKRDLATAEQRVMQLEYQLQNRVVAPECNQDSHCNQCVALENQRIQVERQNQCIALYGEARSACEIMFRGISNDREFHLRFKDCMEKKGFGQGLNATCVLAIR